MNKKRILCIIGQLGSGGSEKQLYLFLKNLDREKYEPYVVVSSTLYIDKWQRGFEEELNIPVKSLGVYPSIVKFLVFKLLLWSFRPDIIFSWSFYTNPFITVSGKIPFVGSLRGGIEESRLQLPPMHFKLAMKPERLIVNSNRLINELRKESFDDEKVFLVKNIYESNVLPPKGVEKVKIREKYNIPKDAILIAGGGRNSDSKDFPLWLDSFESAFKKNPEIYAILFGHGPVVLIKDEAEKRGLDKNIIFTGDTPFVPEILEESNIFFLSSLYEGLPNVVLEAIDAGCEILSTDTAGIRDIFQGDEKLLSSIMLQERDPELAGKMLLQLASEKTSEKEKRQFSDKILSEFNARKIMPLYLAVLSDAERKLTIPVKKKILCVIGQLGNGGSEKQLYLFLKYLDKTKYSATVIVASASGGIWEKRIKKDLDIKITFFKGTSFSKIFKFRRELRLQRPDIIFSWSFFTNAFCVVSGKIPFAGSMRQQYSEDLESLGQARMKLCMLPKKIIVNSNVVADELVSIGVKKSKVQVIFNIFEALYTENRDFQKEKKQIRKKLTEKYSINEDATVIAGIGGESPAKDFPFFIDVFAKLKNEDLKVHALMIGSGFNALKEDIKERKISENSTLTGEIVDAKGMLPCADIYFLSSKTEGMPNVILEAIDSGCCVVTTKVGGISDIFGNLKAELKERIILKDRSPEKASEQIKYLIENPELRQTISNESRKSLDYFRHDVIMNKYMKVLDEFLEEKTNY